MIAYASATNGERNLGALERAGWRLLFTPYSSSRPSSRFAYALDNGAWSSFTQGRPWCEREFVALLRKYGASADWTVLPDVVAGGLASLDLSVRWMRRILDETPRAMLPVQDGMGRDDVASLIGARVGIFVGGSTEWKLATLGKWATLARELGAWCHVGRVNTVKRINLCNAAGATSFDGSSASVFSVTVPKLDHARRQGVLW